jgi:hypothetical protein
LYNAKINAMDQIFGTFISSKTVITNDSVDGHGNDDDGDIVVNDAVAEDEDKGKYEDYIKD